MRTQSLLFDRAAGWTPEKAKAWARSHGYKSGKVDVTDQYVRLRQLDPKGFTVKRTVPFGKGIRAVVAREEKTMPKKKKSTRRPARKSSAKKPKTAHRAAPKRRAAKRRSAPKSKTTVVSARRRRPRRVREAGTGRFAVKAKRRRPRRVREATPMVVAAKRRKPRRRKSAARRKGHASYVMAKRRPRRTAHKKHKKHKKVRAWHGDSAGHSKAAKKGWKGRKGGKSKTKKAAESRRRRPRHVRETTMVVKARRRPKRRHHAREAMVVKARRRPKHRRARETKVVRSYRSHKVRAPNLKSMARTAGTMALEVGAGVAGFLVADAVDRFLATYNPSAASKPSDKFTSDGAGTLANALNVASAPDLWRYGSLAALTVLPLGGSLFIKHAALRSPARGIGIGAGIKLAATFWTNVLMPMLIGKDTSVPALQKSWVARLYPAEVSATLNMKSGTAAVSGSAAGKAGVLSGAGDAGPFALADRFRREERHDPWVTPRAWPQTVAPAAPAFADPGYVAPPAVAAPVQPAWPAHFGERHRWGLRGVGAAIEDMHHTIMHRTGVHPAHAFNAAMHAAAEPVDLTLALQRALPHLRHELLQECARHLHPHVARMHEHARHPHEHAQWTHARAAEGFPAPEHDAPEHEWREWHHKRASAGLPGAPPPPEAPSIAPATPEHLRSHHEGHPKYDRKINNDRFPTVPQVLGIGAGGPASSGYPGQPGLGEVFSDAVQTVAASVPGVPLENAVNTTAYAAAEPFNCTRAIERAMPLIRRELASYCASNVSPYIHQLHEQTGVPMPSPEGAPAPATEAALAPAPAVDTVVAFVPSSPPPGWTRTEAEWHEEEKKNWEQSHGNAHPAVVAATKQAAETAAAPHPDADKPAVQAAVKAVAEHAAQAASATAPGTPAPEVHAAATQAAKAVAADSHPDVADHPAVKAAVKAAATTATAATATPAAPPAAGVSSPPRHLQVGPTRLPHPQGPQPISSECGCLDDSPYLGFVGDEVEEDLMHNMN
jgi:hypothetical protein